MCDVGHVSLQIYESKRCGSWIVGVEFWWRDDIYILNFEVVVNGVPY